MDATESVAGTRRCVAHARSGARCARLPIPGGTVCLMHGGGAPQVAAAARRRLTNAAAAEMLPGLVSPDVLARVVDPDAGHPADRTRAVERIVRARKRQSRSWTAADTQRAREHARAFVAAVADEFDRLTGAG